MAMKPFCGSSIGCKRTVCVTSRWRTWRHMPGLEERTFLRRFRKATEFNPTEYCQRLRIGKAREMLELTGRTIAQVAWDVGYHDEVRSAKCFKR
jgi:transcriptional regulator GlxA family with amidase domain